MSLAITLRPRAEADIDGVFLWYEERLPGLGEVYLRALDACLVGIQRHPEAFPEILPRVRRAALRRFPYGVFYVIRSDRIDVIAIHHVRRRPRRFQP